MKREVEEKINNITIHSIQRCFQRGMKTYKPNYNFVKRNYKQYRQRFFDFLNEEASNKQIKLFNYNMLLSKHWLPGENIYVPIGDKYVIVIRDQHCITFLKKGWTERFQEGKLD